ncbi:hypothetical protein Bbelb_275520 [Branchiostoma belcheri]|nr:hypothetical protein Bbelb_275520 [Branchiostoma belcheri]
MAFGSIACTSVIRLSTAGRDGRSNTYGTSPWSGLSDTLQSACPTRYITCDSALALTGLQHSLSAPSDEIAFNLCKTECGFRVARTSDMVPTGECTYIRYSLQPDRYRNLSSGLGKRVWRGAGSERGREEHRTSFGRARTRHSRPLETGATIRLQDKGKHGGCWLRNGRLPTPRAAVSTEQRARRVYGTLTAHSHRPDNKGRGRIIFMNCVYRPTLTTTPFVPTALL